MRLLICTQKVDKHDPILGFFHSWIREFAKHFDRLDVICLEKGEYDLPKHVHVHSLGKEQGARKITQFVRFYVYFARAFFSRPQYVFFHMGAIYNILAAPFFLLRKLTHTKFYWWKTHGRMNHLKERIAFWFCDNVFTAGSKSFGFVSPKVKIVGHAIDLDMFVLKQNVKQTEHMISVGRIAPIKKIDYAIEVVKELIKCGRRVELDIIGTVDDDGYYKKLQKQVDSGRLSNVNFIGPKTQSELKEEYGRSNILLHPIYQGGLDKVVLEAMAVGVIPLTSIVSYEHILSPFGLYIEAGDIDGYVEAIERILVMSEQGRRSLVENLQSVVEKYHSLHTLSQRIFDIK